MLLFLLETRVLIMQCPQCQTEVVSEAIFCHKCGERLDDNKTTVSHSTAGSETTDLSLAKFNSVASSRMNSKDEPESDLWRGSYSPRAMIGNWISAGIFFIALVVIDLVWLRQSKPWFWLLILASILPAAYALMILCYRKISVHYLLTNHSFVHESGVLRRVTNRIEVIDIDDVSFEQSLVERLFGIGTIRIFSTDHTTPELLLKGIENVANTANLIDNTRRAERRKRGLHIENI
jgi:membrane protein YdbS with pleckstrin-like domain